MKFFIALVAVIGYMLACLAIQSSASPAVAAAVAREDGAAYVDGVEALKQLEPELHGRYKRATCDLLSGMGFGHSACAAHCILRGNRGGYCNSRAVCVCRK